MPENGARSFRHLPGCLDHAKQCALLRDIKQVIALAPFFRPTMPRTGKPFTVRMSNCGTLGWVSDKTGGYRYQPSHPETGAPWPIMPHRLTELWQELARCPVPAEACLINHYEAGTQMGSHQDRDEHDFSAPVLSVSLGDTATFHVGGTKRTDPKTRLTLHSGDVLILEGESRLAFHGIDRIKAGTSGVLAECGVATGGRINLTMRRVSPVTTTS